MGDSADIAVERLTHRFGAVTALSSVSLSFQGGQVHAVIGENGAGKSTLMHILAGLLTPTAGRVLIAGKPVELRSAHAAQRQGIAMIHQELDLVDELTVAQNIYLGREPARAGLLDRAAMNRQAQRYLDMVGSRVRPTDRVGSLSIADCQQVEIARALSQQARVLIMDEPTAVLPQREVQQLLDLIGQLRRAGVTIIYISHLLNEVLAVADRISVLRDGQLVRTVDNDGSLSAHQLANLMVGRELAGQFPPRRMPGQQTVLSVRDLVVPAASTGADSPGPINFQVRAGEILGLAGLIGAGRTSLGETLVGLRGRLNGQVILDGRPLAVRHVRDALEAGLVYLSEDRRGRGLVMGLPMGQNVTLPSLAQFGRMLIRHGRERAAVLDWARQLDLRAASPNVLIDTLSGGNQQKAALARWLMTRPRVLIVDEPTRGVDVGARAEIYQVLHDLTGEGLACILISSEMSELLGMCHRIGVMRAGRLVAMLDGAAATQQQIMQAAAGVEGGGEGGVEGGGRKRGGGETQTTSRQVATH